MTRDEELKNLLRELLDNEPTPLTAMMTAFGCIPIPEESALPEKRARLNKMFEERNVKEKIADPNTNPLFGSW